MSILNWSVSWLLFRGEHCLIFQGKELQIRPPSGLASATDEKWCAFVLLFIQEWSLLITIWSSPWCQGQLIVIVYWYTTSWIWQCISFWVSVLPSHALRYKDSKTRKSWETMCNTNNSLYLLYYNGWGGAADGHNLYVIYTGKSGRPVTTFFVPCM